MLKLQTLIAADPGKRSYRPFDTIKAMTFPICVPNLKALPFLLFDLLRDLRKFFIEYGPFSEISEYFGL